MKNIWLVVVGSLVMFILFGLSYYLINSQIGVSEDNLVNDDGRRELETYQASTVPAGNLCQARFVLGSSADCKSLTADVSSARPGDTIDFTLLGSTDSPVNFSGGEYRVGFDSGSMPNVYVPAISEGNNSFSFSLTVPSTTSEKVTIEAFVVHPDHGKKSAAECIKTIPISPYSASCESLSAAVSAVQPGDVVDFTIKGKTDSPTAFGGGYYKAAVDGGVLGNKVDANKVNKDTFNFSYTVPSDAAGKVDLSAWVQHSDFGALTDQECNFQLDVQPELFACKEMNVTENGYQRGKKVSATCDVVESISGLVKSAQFRVMYKASSDSQWSAVKAPTLLSVKGDTSEVFDYTIADDAGDGDYLIQCRMCKNDDGSGCTGWGKSSVLP